MKSIGIDVDEQKIAYGLYHEIMTEEQQTIMKFGMVDQRIVDVLESQLSEAFDRLVTEQYGVPPDELDALVDGLDVPRPACEAKKKFVQEVSLAVTKALYGVAPMVV